MRRAFAALGVLGLIAGSPAAEEPGPDPLRKLETEAARGDPIAQYNLGVELYRGERVERDLARAAVLWRSAAEAGHVNAHNSLAYLVFYGRGAPRDPAEGLRLWRFAAERGHAESQFHLASAYMTGRDIDRDLVLAYAWARTAVHDAEAVPELGGGPRVQRNASALLAEVRAILPEESRGVAESRAQEFIRVYGPRMIVPP